VIHIGISTAIVQAIQQGQLTMIQDAKRWRAMRWGVSNADSEDARIRHIIETAPDLDDGEIDETPTAEQMNTLADTLVAHLEANGVDLTA
jgi:hypothetical protein